MKISHRPVPLNRWIIILFTAQLILSTVLFIGTHRPPCTETTFEVRQARRKIERYLDKWDALQEAEKLTDKEIRL